MRRIGSDLARGIRQEAQQTNQSALQTLSRLNQSFSQLSSQISQSQIAENRAIADSSARITEAGLRASAQKSQETQQFLQTVGQVAGTINQQVEQRRAAKQKQLQQQEFVRAFTELSGLTTNADRIVTEKGDAAFIQSAFDTLAKFPNIKYEDKVKLIDQAYKATGRVNQDLFTKTQKRTEEINNTITATKKSELSVRLAGITSRLSTGNFDNIETVLKEADDIVSNFIDQPSLNDLQRMKIYADSLEVIAENSEAGLAYKSRLQAKAQSYFRLMQDERFTSAVQRYREGNLSAQEWEFTMMTLGDQYDIPLANVRTLGDPIGSEREALERQNIQTQLSALHRQGIARDMSQEQFDRTSIAYYGYAMVNDPQVFYQLESVYKDNPQFQTMVALRDTITEYEEKRLEVSKESLKLDKALAVWQQGATRTIRSVDQANSQSQDLLKVLGQLGREQLVANMTAGVPQREQYLTDQEYLEEMRNWYQLGVDVINKERSLLTEELKPLARRLEGYGLLEAVEQDNFQLIQQRYTDMKSSIQQQYEASPKNAIPGGQNGNFNQGSIRTNINFASVNDPRDGTPMAVPFRADVASQLRVTSHRNPNRVHPVTGKVRPHAGVDIAAPIGTEINFYDHGTVDAIKTDPNGYGYYIDIKDREGKIHRFAHLKSRSPLKVGQTVNPGTILGRAGNSGIGTGAHLHWEIRSAERRYGYDGTYDVEALAKDYNRRISQKKVRGDNTQLQANLPNPYTHDTTENFINSTAPKNSLVLGAAAFLSNNMIGGIGNDTLRNVAEVFNVSKPYKNKLTPSNKNNFDVSQNKPSNNYGYTFLAQNPNHAKKINEVATRLGIPGYWLADIIGFESGFSTSIDQSAGLPYTGLIQFGDTAAERMGTSRAELRKMNFDQQMEYVYQYFSFPEFRGKLDTVDKLLAAVWGGAGLVNRIERDPKSALKISDGFINFEGYLKKLGKDVGRKYEIPYMNGRRRRVASPTHTSFVEGCPICNQLRQSGSFVPHEGTD